MTPREPQHNKPITKQHKRKKKPPRNFTDHPIRSSPKNVKVLHPLITTKEKKTKRQFC